MVVVSCSEIPRDACVLIVFASGGKIEVAREHLVRTQLGGCLMYT